LNSPEVRRRRRVFYLEIRMQPAQHAAVLHLFALSPLCPPATRDTLLSSLSCAPAAVAQAPLPRTDRDALLSAFRFLGGEGDCDSGGGSGAAAWEARVASRYWAALNKEFALADLSRCPAALGLRWRSAAEVAAGVGQFTCGALGCDAVAGLHSYEVPFSYVEGGEEKSALVKLRCCGACAARAFAKPAARAKG
jgi:hypothetical protein